MLGVGHSAALAAADPEPSWEAGAASLERGLLTPAGLVVEHLGRAPYLCRGDSGTALHVLDAAILVCKRQAESDPCARARS